ncbi:hypothetical protein AB0L85_24105 [Streptomyces sp. NPDC052051]
MSVLGRADTTSAGETEGGPGPPRTVRVGYGRRASARLGPDTAPGTTERN